MMPLDFYRCISIKSKHMARNKIRALTSIGPSLARPWARFRPLRGQRGVDGKWPGYVLSKYLQSVGMAPNSCGRGGGGEGECPRGQWPGIFLPMYWLVSRPWMTRGASPVLRCFLRWYNNANEKQLTCWRNIPSYV